MNQSFKTIASALEALFSQLQSKVTPLSFVLMVGKVGQGKALLLKKSQLTHYPLAEEGVALYYHEKGVVLNLCESWLLQQNMLLSHVLKLLNHIHPGVRVSGLILCVDIQRVFQGSHDEGLLEAEKQTLWLKRFMEALGYPVPVFLFFTQCDKLAGFVPFFQSEHASEWREALGFTIENRINPSRHYRTQYDKLVESLGRRVLQKLHAVRSSTLRTLIREFPLQLASIRPAVQSLVETIFKAGIHVKGIYLTSAASQADSEDRLHAKIEQAYGLLVPQDLLHIRAQPAYFVEGALMHVFAQTQSRRAFWPKKWKGILLACVSFFVVATGFVSYQHIRTAQLLDETSQELLAYDLLIRSGHKPTSAAYHLTSALRTLEAIPKPMQQLNPIKKLQMVIRSHTQKTIEHRFLPAVIEVLEQEMRASTVSPFERYEALKTYLRLVDGSHYNAVAIRAWFEPHMHQFHHLSLDKAKALLDEVLMHPVKVEMNQGLVQDIRNQLNAMPAGYFYYSLIKKRLQSDTKPLAIPGFQLVHTSLPKIYTSTGFSEMLTFLHQATDTMMQEQWVLARQDLTNLESLLIQAYCFEYVTWWKQLIKQSHLSAVHNFEEAEQLAEQLLKTKALMQFIALVQTHTQPIKGKYERLFNESIATQFTAIHFFSQGAIDEIDKAIQESVHFLATIAVMHDNGQTIFSFTKARFQGDTFSDALSLLYQRSHGLPDMVSDWVRHYADSIWSLLIQQTRQYINARWESQVYQPYLAKIAHRYPFDTMQTGEVRLTDFDAFFAPSGVLASFVDEYLKPFIDTSKPQWRAKVRDGLVMPISEDMMNELIRANVIGNMFFPGGTRSSHIVFNLEKANLDPVVSKLTLLIGKAVLEDNQAAHVQASFEWPASDAELKIDSIEGGHFNIAEQGVWALFKMLQKVNVLVDPDDPATLQILFELNGNSGRYILKTQNQINPFSPGVLDGFVLEKAVV